MYLPDIDISFGIVSSSNDSHHNKSNYEYNTYSSNEGRVEAGARTLKEEHEINMKNVS